MMTATRLLPLTTVARRLKVPSKWLRCEAESGRIPCLIADKKILCDLEAVESALLDRARKPAGTVEGRADAM